MFVSVNVNITTVAGYTVFVESDQFIVDAGVILNDHARKRDRNHGTPIALSPATHKNILTNFQFCGIQNSICVSSRQCLRVHAHTPRRLALV
jgi:hypothetical protein